jgi:hypothetical protein
MHAALNRGRGTNRCLLKYMYRGLSFDVLSGKKFIWRGFRDNVDAISVEPASSSTTVTGKVIDLR